MSMDWQVGIFAYCCIAVMVFVCSSVALNDRWLPDRDRIWIGRIGLAAPIWPVAVVIGLVVGFVFLLGELRRAAAGKP